MSPAEAFVGVAGLAAGYWLVSLYFDGSKKGQQPSDPPQEQPGRTNSSDSRQSEGDEIDEPESRVSESEWWEVLGVSPNSSDQEVRSAHKRLVSLCHPDRVSHLSKELQLLATKQTQELNAALSKYEYFARRGH